MESTQRVPKTELARNTRKVIREAQHGYTVVVESHGRAEVVILDIVDYRLLRAFSHFYAKNPEVSGGGLDESVALAAGNIQDKFDLVMAYYIEEEISLGRMAELLGLPWIDLQARLLRLDLPIKIGALDETDAYAEIEAARDYDSDSRS
ncbi:MAG: type II toxin-antitoxin system prevent-host-death family antitoxin [Chloroflexota bacterium]|nr:type II toxin-antitoxin system prevent-host-death family antitoxin [Chloroflexota bacterium]